MKIYRRIVIAVLAVIFLIFACWSGLKTTCYTVVSSKISEEICIAVISDLHCTEYGREQTKLIETVREQKPDLIFLTGDIYDRGLSSDKAEILMSKIAGIAPSYFIAGNNEYYSGKADEYRSQAKAYGVTVLADSYATVTVKGQSFVIAGAKEFLNPKDRIWNRIAELSGYKILLCHKPTRVEKYTKYGFDLAVSGHTHGGQIRIPHILNGIYAPEEGLFPKYAGGIYNIDGTDMIVSKGLSKTHPRISRIFNRPEIVIVHVRPGTNTLGLNIPQS